MVTAIEGIPVANDVDFVRELSIIKARSSPSPSQQLFEVTLRSTTLGVPRATILTGEPQSADSPQIPMATIVGFERPPGA